MKFKLWLWLSGLCVFTTFVFCVSIYAYNAYCVDPPKVSNGVVTISAAMNNSDLKDGYYAVHARVGNPPGTTQKNTYKSQQLSLSLSASGSSSQSGYGSAYVDGTNMVNTFCSKFDSVTY